MATSVERGTIVQFNDNSRARCKDPCFVASVYVTRGGSTEYAMMPIEGALKGKLFTYKLRFGVVIDQFCKIKRVSPAVREAAAQLYLEATGEKHAREHAGFDILRSIAPGDLVEITISGKRACSYGFKVYEVDYKANRLKGFQPGLSNPGSRMGWVNVAHQDVSVSMLTKAFFDPATDYTGEVHAARKQAATDKRNATRARRKQLNDFFGSL